MHKHNPAGPASFSAPPAIAHCCLLPPSLMADSPSSVSIVVYVHSYLILFLVIYFFLID
jgi:hypothetical protein